MRTVVGKVVGVLDGDGAKVYAQLSGHADDQAVIIGAMRNKTLRRC